MNSFLVGRFIKVLGGQKDGTYFNADGKCRAILIVEEDQSYTPKGKEGVERLVNIPVVFFGKEADRLANNPNHYDGKMIRVDYSLGGYNPEGDKWYPNINGKWVHTWEGEGLENTDKTEAEIDIPY